MKLTQAITVLTLRGAHEIASDRNEDGHFLFSLLLLVLIMRIGAGQGRSFL
ncbi:MAG: hypothetical protein KDD64_01670 [Bdellovibrionales bacterium]|nr:hypothetical protein [Bdellovibrionales bacterium]